MRSHYILLKITFYTLVFAQATIVMAQSGQKDENARLQATILHLDSLFWHAYNTCNVDSMSMFLTDDLEFYHDKGGITTTLEKFRESIQTGLCAKEDWRQRRDIVPGTAAFFPMRSSGKLYGAILSGEHVFYIREAGKKEYLDGHARFTHLWRNVNDTWKMARLLSYDHGPAAYISKRKETDLPAAQLKRFAGRYNSPHAGVMTITTEESSLKLTGKNIDIILYPETENFFFLKDRDLQFEFVEKNKKITKVIVHERGNIVEEARKKR